MTECDECNTLFDVTLFDEESEVKFCPCCGEELDT